VCVCVCVRIAAHISGVAKYLLERKVLHMKFFRKCYVQFIFVPNALFL
jgi:hypothetical protein